MKLNILLVDDVPENRMLGEILLTKQGHNVVQCCNGREAVELSQKEAFDMILMDVQMPEMDGLEATRAIRNESGLCQNSNIIAMTASVTKGDELMCLDAGCDDYIAKPVKKEALLRKVERHIQTVKQMQAVERGQELISCFADDSDYTKTIEMFVENLPERIDEIRQALQDNDLKELALKVHSLKGLGTFAGFPVYTQRAKSIEENIKQNNIDTVQEQVDDLVKLCMRTKMQPS